MNFKFHRVNFKNYMSLLLKNVFLFLNMILRLSLFFIILHFCIAFYVCMFKNCFKSEGLRVKKKNWCGIKEYHQS